MHRMLDEFAGLKLGSNLRVTQREPPKPKAPRTPKQIEASRRNGRRSRGPKTEAGKARSSLNATVHGLLSTRLGPADDAEGTQDDYRLLAEALVEEFSPQTAMEQTLVHALAVESYRLLRIQQYSFAAMTSPSPGLLHHGSSSPAIVNRGSIILEDSISALTTGRAIRWAPGDVAVLTQLLVHEAHIVQGNAEDALKAKEKFGDLVEHEQALLAVAERLAPVVEQASQPQELLALLEGRAAADGDRQAMWLELLERARKSQELAESSADQDAEEIGRRHIQELPWVDRSAPRWKVLHEYERRCLSTIRQLTAQIEHLQQRRRA